MRILISSRNTLIPAGLNRILEAAPHDVIVQHFHSTEQLLAKCILERTEVLILDKSDNELFTPEQLGVIQSRLPKVKTILLVSGDVQDSMQGILQLGLSGYLSAFSSEDEVLECLRVINSGGQYICHRILPAAIPGGFKPVEQVVRLLTEREMQVARSIAEGKTSKEIAGILGISPHTVQTHRKSMMKKLSVSSAREVTLFVLDLNGSIPSGG